MPETPTVVDNVAPAVEAILPFVGPWGVIAALILKTSVPFVDKLIYNAHHNVAVTPDEWAVLRDRNETPGEVLIPKRPQP